MCIYFFPINSSFRVYSLKIIRDRESNIVNYNDVVIALGSTPRPFERVRANMLVVEWSINSPVGSRRSFARWIGRSNIRCLDDLSFSLSLSRESSFTVFGQTLINSTLPDESSHAEEWDGTFGLETFDLTAESSCAWNRIANGPSLTNARRGNSQRCMTTRTHRNTSCTDYLHSQAVP